MKLSLSLSILLLFASNAWAEWTHLGQALTATGATGAGEVYVDYETIKSNKGSVYAWTMQNYLKRRDTGTIAEEDWMVGGDTRGYMGGGIVGIRKPNAIPPERQGLRSIMINGKKS